MARLDPVLRNLSRSAAREAIYIDFEGVGKSRSDPTPRPSFLGIWHRGHYEAKIIDPVLGLLSRGVTDFPGPRLVEADLNQIVIGLIEAADEAGAVILHFSQYEAGVIAHHCSREVNQSFGNHARNAKLLIDRWAKKRPVQCPAERTLEAYCGLAKIACPEAPGQGVGESLRRLARACSKERRWSKLSERHKKLARDLFEYNRLDCEVLQKLTKKATSSLAVRVEP